MFVLFNLPPDDRLAVLALAFAAYLWLGNAVAAVLLWRLHRRCV